MADITRRSRIHLTGVPGRENRMRERERGIQQILRAPFVRGLF